jgi:hypothetical protein
MILQGSGPPPYGWRVCAAAECAAAECGHHYHPEREEPALSTRCEYCWGPVPADRVEHHQRKRHCSDAHAKRNGEWNSWVSRTSYGKRGPALPPNGKAAAAAIASSKAVVPDGFALAA